MSKRPLTVFAALFIALAVGIPLWAIDRDADSSSSPAEVAPKDEAAKVVFSENCGPCHTLRSGGTNGVVGPNLDKSDVTGSADAVLGFILNGASGRMPAGILQGERAKVVAEFVAKYAGT